MEFTAQMIAGFLGGTIEGNPDEKVSTVAKIEEATKGSLAFLANPKYIKYIYETEASIVLVNRDLKLTSEVKSTLIRVKDAYQAFASLLQMYEQSKPKKEGTDQKASIASSAKLGTNLYIGAFVSIGENVKIGDYVKIFPNVTIGDNVVIGNDTTIHSGVNIYHECVLGNHCIIHAGTVIGSDGFGFALQENGEFQKIPQIGNVVIEDDVEIGANCAIDRATMGSTFIRRGVKIDNLVQIAHNVEVGENTVIVSQAGIAGSSKVGKRCMIGGQVGIVGHITIADDVKIAAQSGVPNHVKTQGMVLLGSPAMDIQATRKAMAIYRNLPELRNKLIELEKQLKELKEK